MSRPDPKEILKSTEIFKDLGEDAYDSIAGLIHWRTYNKGAEVMSYKDVGRDIYFIGEGRVRATIYSFSGKEISYQAHRRNAADAENCPFTLVPGSGWPVVFMTKLSCTRNEKFAIEDSASSV